MSRIDDLKAQNKLLDISIIDILAHLDPSSTYKYTGFLIKILKNELGDEDIKDVLGNILFDEKNIVYLRKFEKHTQANRIKNPDISKYKSLDDVIREVNDADEIVRIKQSEKQIIKIHEDDNYLILIPLTYEASKTYGANTKWCVTQETYWKQYQWKWRLIYVIDKKGKKKYAISKKYDDPYNIQGWLENDNETNPMLFPIPEEYFTHIMKYLRMDFFQPELSIIDDNSIMTDEGLLISIDDASIEQVKRFLTKHESRLSKTHLANLRSIYGRSGTKITDEKKNPVSTTTSTPSSGDNSMGDAIQQALNELNRSVGVVSSRLIDTDVYGIVSSRPTGYINDYLNSDVYRVNEDNNDGEFDFYSRFKKYRI
jgi:hypothetical protein